MISSPALKRRGHPQGSLSGCVALAADSDCLRPSRNSIRNGRAIRLASGEAGGEVEPCLRAFCRWGEFVVSGLVVTTGHEYIPFLCLSTIVVSTSFSAQDPCENRKWRRPLEDCPLSLNSLRSGIDVCRQTGINDRSLPREALGEERRQSPPLRRKPSLSTASYDFRVP